MINSKDVNKAIREEIRPYLKDIGFSVFTGKGAWRYSELRIDVILIESFNAHNAYVQGCTTFSFQVQIGCYFPWIPAQDGLLGKQKKGKLMPHYADCPYNRPLLKTIIQLELQNKFIWYIGYDGQYLQEALSDLKLQLQTVGLPYFDKFNSPKAVLDWLEDIRQSYGRDGMWDNGDKPSPEWLYYAGYVALHLKDYEQAFNYLKPLEKYKDLYLAEDYNRIVSDIQRLKKLNNAIEADRE